MSGALLHYGFLFALFGSALLLFWYCYKKNCLSFDEEAKYQMMEEDKDKDKEEDG